MPRRLILAAACSLALGLRRPAVTQTHLLQPPHRAERASSDASPGAPFGVDLDGHPLPSLSAPNTRAVVLLFLATDCPVSNRYQPTINGLRRQFAPQHVAFFAVYPNPAETPTLIRMHRKLFAEQAPALLDPRQSLVHLAGARTTPEAAVFLPTPHGLQLAYRGRIDDRYLSLGTQRPQPTRNDLAAAIRAVLADTPAPAAGRPAVGCSIIPISK